MALSIMQDNMHAFEKHWSLPGYTIFSMIKKGLAKKKQKKGG